MLKFDYCPNLEDSERLPQRKKAPLKTGRISTMLLLNPKKTEEILV